MFGGFGDIFLNEEANEEVCKFLRSKISQIVHDPVKAAVLTPREPYTRRPLCDNGYWSKFNYENVHAIDLQKTPLLSVEENGILTADGTLHELDVLILATGFHAVDGSLKAIRGGIKGRNGVTLNDHWDCQPKTFMSLFISSFPNLFLIGGPQGPFSSAPPGVAVEVDFLTDLLRIMESRKVETVEPSPEAESRWVETCDLLASKFLVWKTRSWMTGTNIPDAKPSALFYYEGLHGYIKEIQKLKAGNYKELIFI